MDTFTYAVLVPMVYAAFLVFVCGTAWQIIRLRSRPSFKPSLKLYPERHPAWLHALGDAFLMPMIRKQKPVLWFILMLMHACFLLLILGHLELLADMPWLQIWPHEIFVGAGYVGVLSFICLVLLLFRRFVPPSKDLSVPEDYYLLIVLILAVVFGSEMHLARRLYLYDSMGVAEYRAYLMSLVQLRPDLEAISASGHRFMLVLHVLFANLFLIFFPFSKMMHSILSIPANMLRRR